MWMVGEGGVLGRCNSPMGHEQGDAWVRLLDPMRQRSVEQRCDGVAGWVRVGAGAGYWRCGEWWNGNWLWVCGWGVHQWDPRWDL